MSKPFIFLLVLLCFLGGIAIASFFNIGFIYWLIPCLLLLLLILIVKPKFALIVFLCFLAFFLGLGRYNLAEHKVKNQENISSYINQEIVFEGQLSSPPDIRQDKLLLTLDKIKINNKEIEGKILVFSSLYPKYYYGDVLKIKGKIEEVKNFSNFNYQGYLARSGIYALCFYPKIESLGKNQGNPLLKAVFTFRDKSREKILKSFNEPQASLASALLLGLKKEFPQEAKDWFSKTGTSHLLAISGMHIGILTYLLNTFLINFLFVSRRKTIWLIIPIMSVFVILVGAPASAIRALLMALVLLYGQYLGRPSHSFNALIFVACLMLLFNPFLLAFDIGFQLSFLAMIGILFFSQPFFHFFSSLPNFPFFPLRDLLSITLSAQIFTLPLILYYFKIFPWSAPLVNILVVPVLPLAMIFGFLFLFFSFIPFLNQILLWLAWIPLTYILGLVKLFAQLPYFELSLSPFLLAVVYIFLIVLVYLWKEKNYAQSSA